MEGKLSPRNLTLGPGLARMRAEEKAELWGEQSYDRDLTRGEVVGADLAGDETLLKLARYEAQIERAYYRALDGLQRMQESRRARESASDDRGGDRDNGSS